MLLNLSEAPNCCISNCSPALVGGGVLCKVERWMASKLEAGCGQLTCMKRNQFTFHNANPMSYHGDN